MSFRKKQAPHEIEEAVLIHPNELIRKKLKLLLDAYYYKDESLIAEAIWLCHILDVPHRQQSGFNCGLVALRMVAEFLQPSLLVPPPSTPSFTTPVLSSSPTLTHTTPTPAVYISPHDSEAVVHITPLFSLAQELKFTNEGEIFSSENLATLAEQHFGLRVKVLCPFSSRDVIHHLLAGLPLLIPYDADKNYAPCVANGKHPHWAVVRGFVYKLPSSSPVHVHFSSHEGFVEVDQQRPSWVYTSKPSNEVTVPSQIEDEHLYLICQHGKSKNLALWGFTTLFQSNQSLTTPDEAKKSAGRWLIPDDLSALQGSVLLLYPPLS